MKITYDQKVDSLYFNLIDSKVFESEEIDPGVVYDYDEKDQVVGIEVLFLKGRTPEQVKHINFPFSKEEKAVLKEFFVNVFA